MGVVKMVEPTVGNDVAAKTTAVFAADVVAQKDAGKAGLAWCRCWRCSNRVAASLFA